MPIVDTDIKFYLSGGASNSDPDASTGGARSTTTVVPSDLFDDVSAAEATAGDTEYRCFYVFNDHATLTLQSAKIFIDTNTSGDRISIALDGAGKNGEAETEADESTAPTGETFSQPANYAGGLSLGDLAPDEYYAVWVKRVIPSSASGATDTWSVTVQGETNP